jgi:hypothetical protein
MEHNTTPMEKLFTEAEGYSKTKIELLELYAIEKFADIISTLATKLLIFLVVVLFILTVNIGLALWIGEIMGKPYYGFFVVGGFYLFISILLYIFRLQWIKIPISNYIIVQMIKKI